MGAAGIKVSSEEREDEMEARARLERAVAGLIRPQGFRSCEIGKRLEFPFVL